MYKLTTSRSISRIADGASIPNDPGNNDYAEYLGWLDAGGTPLPADTPPAPTYRELRAVLYPSIGDQLDALWKGGGAAAAMLEVILAVKAEVPKP